MKFCPRGGAPVAQQHVLDVAQLQRALEQRVIGQVNLPDGEAVLRTPVGVELREERWSEGVHWRALSSVVSDADEELVVVWASDRPQVGGAEVL
jgi:hypothetical protein